MEWWWSLLKSICFSTVDLKQKRIEVVHPTALDEPATTAPTNLDQPIFAQSLTNDPTLPTTLL
jgi:hypothetical protein